MGGRHRNSTKRNTPENAVELARLLAEQWPEAVVELDHKNAYQLLVATILAAQSTDKMINTLTPALFERYPDAHALAEANPAELEPMIFKSGFFRQKAKSLIAMAQALVQRHGGEVPRTLDELVQVRGVGRKTANVVLGNALDVHEGIVVDTHVTRLAQRLGLTTNTDPVKIEQDLMEIVPRDQWTSFANRLIWHGRRVCHAKKPDHDHCILAPLCPSATLVQLPSTRRPSKRPPPAGKGTKIAEAAKTAVKKAAKKAKPKGSGR